MRISFIVGVVLALATGPALAQGVGQPTLLDPHPAVPHPQLSPAPAQSAPPAAARSAPAAAAAKPAHPSAKTPRAAAKAPSTPESRSAAALALSSEPVFDEGTYQRIKEALFSYSAIQVRGGWPALPADAKLTPESTGPTVALLRQHLVISDDLAPEQEQGDTYDAAVIEAVKRFQTRHGLEATGNVDAKTLKAMNVPVGERIKQLEASLERLLGMDFVFAERYVVVNIPAAFVEAISHDKVERRYRVIVGKIDKPSPTLTAFITAVNLNPTWTVPLSITKSEIRAHMRRDPTYLSRMHMRVLGARDEEIDPQTVDWSSDRSPNFTVRQDSGGFNALGNLKIDMPNPYSVYMHDTTTRNLVRQRLPFRLPRLHAGRQRARSRGLDPRGRAAVELRRDRRRHRCRRAQDHQPAAQDAGGLGLPDRLGDARWHRPVPRGCLQARPGTRPREARRDGARRRLRRADAARGGSGRGSAA